jgi:vitamin B12 transporter
MSTTANIRTLRLAALFAVALSGLSTFAHAQTSDSIAVADSARARLVQHAPLIVTAGRIAQRPDRIGFAFTTITRADLLIRRPATAADALRDVAGAGIDEAVGAGGPSIIRLRGGEEVFTQVMMDGVVINANGGFFDFQGLGLTSVDRIEIVRGPQSAMHGSSAVSGVVHMMTSAGLPGAPRVALEAEGGGASQDGGSYRVTGAVTGGTNSWTYNAAGATSYDRGYFRVPHDIRGRDGVLRVDGRLSSRLDLTTIVRFAGVDANHPVRDPGATRAPLDPNAAVGRDRLIASARAHLRGAHALSHELSLSAYKESFVYYDERDDIATEPGAFPFFVFDANLDFRSRLVRSTAEYVGRWQPASAYALALAWGAQLQRETLRERVTFEATPGGQTLSRNGGALFAEATAAPVQRLNLSLGARVERFGDLTSDVTPRASAMFVVAPERLTLRVAAGRAYKAPNLQEQYVNNPFIRANPDLAPETSSSVEGGIDARMHDGRFALSLTAFHQTFENLIRTVALEGSDQQINRNLGESRATGVEWEARWVPAHRWLVGLDGSKVATEVINNLGLSEANFPKGEALPFRPDLIAGAFAEMPVGAKLTAQLRANYIGEQIVLTERFSGERKPVDAYFLLGANLRYAVTPAVELYVRADNILGTDYRTGWDRAGAPARASLGGSWHAR